LGGPTRCQPLRGRKPCVAITVPTIGPRRSSSHSIDFLEPLSNAVSGLHRGWRLPSPATSQSARKDSRQYLFIIMIRSLNALMKLMNGAARAKCIRSKDRRRQDESAELHNERRNPKTSFFSKLIIQHLLGYYLSSLLGISQPTFLKFCLFQTPSNHSSGENKHSYPVRSRSSLRHLG
jgi:hypothetical protein